MSTEISGAEQKRGKKKVEVQEVMQKRQPLWCTSEISFLVLCFSFSKSAAGNYSPLIIAESLFFNFYFYIYILHVFTNKVAAVTLMKWSKLRQTQHITQVTISDELFFDCTSASKVIRIIIIIKKRNGLKAVCIKKTKINKCVHSRPVGEGK